ncbi:hypothetical protein GCM10010478_31350 [Streptomyces erythrogriseus]|uniref:Uncharacterized protein n=3 Tax=Streptomyces TaxID=1883 RepID=A0ABN3WXS6_9ACTN|nr:hypothetical protein GCM10010265_16520 [Streptomyces griseoincarnatus]GGT39043.1 hypothetical protein GCM10010287_09640 [Streptomyces variabilis]
MEETRFTAAGFADAPASGVPFTTSAWAVYTEAPTASIVTPSAAPTTLPYQLRPPPCRAMSRPAFLLSLVARVPDFSGNHWAGRDTDVPGCVRYGSRTHPGTFADRRGASHGPGARSPW